MAVTCDGDMPRMFRCFPVNLTVLYRQKSSLKNAVKQKTTKNPKPNKKKTKKQSTNQTKKPYTVETG